jgi:hypothetical protein
MPNAVARPGNIVELRLDRTAEGGCPNVNRNVKFLARENGMASFERVPQERRIASGRKQQVPPLRGSFREANDLLRSE